MKNSLKPFILGLLLFIFSLGPVHAALAIGSFGIDSWLVNTGDLQKKVAKLGDEAVKSIPLPILIGAPLEKLTANFGDKRPGGRKHEGLDIMAPMGSVIVSPTEAVVLKVGYGDSAGFYVYTANPGGEIFAYMHLQKPSELEAGDELEEGDLIGYVGNSGNARGGSPHLHFEVRKNGPTDPFVRITKEFDADEKLSFLEKIIDGVKDTKVAVVTKDAAADDEDESPLKIEKEENAITLPNTDLKLGAKGDAVKELQKFLIEENVGTSVAKLAKAGATGYFGEITQKALAEYQASVGIAPAKGYYGAVTRKFIAQNI